ncbi:MAG: hypothetical protein KIT84_42485 [Labilithrix sp.]|nr:hypothetical protein [Labilithrix sp.]MCW5817745.1 hypothetical protein [Labilithrix sp.]
MADSDAPNAADSLSREERAFLTALNDLGVRYLLVGMSAALLQGATLATEDINLWFEDIADERIGEAARRAGAAWVTRMQPPRLAGAAGERFDVVTTMDGLPDFAAEYAGSIAFDLGGLAIRVLPLQRIIASKRAAGRAKDRAALVLLEATARLLQATAKRGRAPGPKEGRKRRS